MGFRSLEAPLKVGDLILKGLRLREVCGFVHRKCMYNGKGSFKECRLKKVPLYIEGLSALSGVGANPFEESVVDLTLSQPPPPNPA